MFPGDPQITWSLELELEGILLIPGYYKESYLCRFLVIQVMERNVTGLLKEDNLKKSSRFLSKLLRLQ